MSGIKKTSATLRFLGDNLDPERITRLLQCLPSRAARKGEELNRRRLRPRPARTGVWSLEIEWNATQDLEQQISELLDQLPEDLQIWSQVMENAEGDLFCGLGVNDNDANQGLSLSPPLMKRIAERNLRLEVFLHCDGETETDRQETRINTRFLESQPDL